MVEEIRCEDRDSEIEMRTTVDLKSESILKLIKLPDLLTICNGIFGFYAILIVLAGSGTEGALVAILSAAVIDGMDGMIARKIESSPIGRYLDSLADMLSFGTAPAVIAFALQNGTFIAAVCSAYMVCGMLRLARFDATATMGDGFVGLPITGSAVCLSSFMLLALELQLNSSLLLPLFMAVLCVLMVSRLRYGNIRDLRLGIPIGCLFFAIIPLYLLHSTLIIYPVAILAGLSTLYLFSPLLSCYFLQ